MKTYMCWCLSIIDYSEIFTWYFQSLPLKCQDQAMIASLRIHISGVAS